MTDQATPAFSQEDVNRALAEQFAATGPADQPMRLAGELKAESATDAARVPASALKPEPSAKPHVEQSGLQLPAAKVGGVPGWFKLPDKFTFPRGRQVHFIRFRAEWTDTPWKGERQCCLWSMGVGDKKIALMRSMGDALRAQDEMLKQTLRIVDGSVVTLEDGSLDVWWDEIGEKCRTLLTRVFAQLHFLKPEQLTDFFSRMRRYKEHELTRDRRGHLRDPADVSRSAFRLLFYSFEPRRELAVLAGHSMPFESAPVLKALMKSCVYLARYLRQPMAWVESLALDEFNRWLDVVSEVLVEERGGSPDRERADPMAALMGDD